MSSSFPLWREIQKQNFTHLSDLANFLQLTPSLRSKLLDKPAHVLNVPYRLAQKMAKNTLNDPLVRQFVPLQEEETPSPDFVDDPLQDKLFRRTQKLLKKYEKRALIITTGACVMNCRFCFRKKFPYETEIPGFEKELATIAADDTLNEVILSGGDPLSLGDKVLANLLSSLDQIPHLKRIRFHTRFPIGIPERIDESFLSVLSSSIKQIIFVLHCNHPKELDSDVIHSLKKIQKLGIVILNQSVLLKGVNDDENTLLQLFEMLTNVGIIPYYLHLNDRTTGNVHFDVSKERGEELIEYLKAHLSGYGVPRLVREEPYQKSKTVYA